LLNFQHLIGHKIDIPHVIQSKLACPHAAGTEHFAKELPAEVLGSGCCLCPSPQMTPGVMTFIFILTMVCSCDAADQRRQREESGQPHQVCNLQHAAASKQAHNNIRTKSEVYDAVTREGTDHQWCHPGQEHNKVTGIHVQVTPHASSGTGPQLIT
jgi:hypothetical protein